MPLGHPVKPLSKVGIETNFEKYLYWVGEIDWTIRAPLLVAAGFMLYPGTLSFFISVGIVVACYAYGFITKRAKS